MTWILISILPPLFWSITNHIDKYLLEKYVKGGGVGALMIFSSLIGLVVTPLIFFFNPQVFDISTKNAIFICLNSFFYILSVLPYFYALNEDETSNVVPLFQVTPVMSYILSYFVLKETLTKFQIIGGILVMIGAIGISIKFQKNKSIKIKSKVFRLMMLSSLLYTINVTFFKYFALGTNFWTTSFWEYIGLIIFGLTLLIFVKSYRLQFLDLMKNNKFSVISLNGLNETINLTAKITFNYASMLAPITLVWIISGLQPFFVFLFGIILTIFFPQISKENISKERLIQKLLSILVMFIGSLLINM